MSKPKVVHESTEHFKGSDGLEQSVAAIATLGFSAIFGFGEEYYETTLVLDNGETIKDYGSTEAESIAEAYSKYHEEYGEDDDD